MKLADMIDAFMGASSALEIPLPRVQTSAQAERAWSDIVYAVPQFEFTLTIRGGLWYLIATRRVGSIKVPYDA